jgi:hypothetical protein
MLYKFLSISMFMGTLLVAAPLAHAQLANSDDPLNLIVAPETPGPYQQVQLEVQGIGPFLGNSIITWSRNGQVVARGLGKTGFSFTTGAIGTADKIDIDVNSPQGEYKRIYVFAPSLVDMLWEADTSVPLFYQGKSLYSAGSKLKILAYPVVAVGNKIATNDKLTFQWSLNDTPALSQSGLGKNTFIFNGSMLHQSETAKVDIYYSGAKVAHGQISVPAVNPMLLVYNKDPLRGEVIDQALPTTFSLGSSEVTLQAEPYYFDNTSLRSGKVSYSWMLNNQETTGPQSAQGILTLRQSGQGKGFASLSIEAQNSSATSLLQQAQTELSILFGSISNSSSAPLFGI